MNILVTGGAGFIGSVLVPELLRVGHNVRILDNLSQCSGGLKGIEDHARYFGLLCGDVSNQDDLKAMVKGAHIVVHLAALRQKECIEDPERAWAVNYYAAENLADLCAEKDIKLIFASSCSVYGVSKGPATEETVPIPISTYARTKVCAEKSVLEAGGIVVRFATAYGGSPCMRKDLIVHQFLAGAMKGKIAVFDPAAWRALIHVKDIAKGILLSVQTEADGQIFNLGGGNYMKRELARIICEHLPEVTIEETQCNDIRDYQVAFGKACKVLGFVPDHNVKDWIGWVCRLIKLNPGLMILKNGP